MPRRKRRYRMRISNTQFSDMKSNMQFSSVCRLWNATYRLAVFSLPTDAIEALGKNAPFLAFALQMSGKRCLTFARVPCAPHSRYRDCRSVFGKRERGGRGAPRVTLFLAEKASVRNNPSTVLYVFPSTVLYVFTSPTCRVEDIERGMKPAAPVARDEGAD